jgi:predicted phage-related endonuclease
MSEPTVFYPVMVQGSPEWKAHRAKFLNASDAPAMMGESANCTRLALLTQFTTGVGPEHSIYVEEVVFPAGHEAEARCRMLAEEVMGTELAPSVATRGRLGASYDGLDMLGEMWWEHKSMNAALRKCMVPGATGADLPPQYRIQLEQEAMVLGAKRGLFSASEWSPAGELIDHRSVWYDSDPELAARIAAGWDQFIVDAANHTPVVEPVKPTAAPIKSLPALLVQVRGEVVASNIKEYRAASVALLAGISTSLETDQDFEDAAAAVKACQAAEDRLARLMEDVFAQAASIDEVRRSVDEISGMFRTKRLALDKLCEARKKSLRAEIVTEHQDLLTAHVKALNDTNRRGWIPRTTADFQEAIKGKRTFTSMREACGVLLMQKKLALNEQQNLMTRNWAALTDAEGVDWAFLLADFSAVGTKPAEDFKAIADARIAAHKAAAEAKRLKDEAQKKAAEDAKRLAEETAAAAAVAAQASTPAAAPVVAVPVALQVPTAAEQPMSASMMTPAELAAVRQPAARQPDEIPSLPLGTINALFGAGFSMTSQFVNDALGVPHRNTTGSGKLYYESDLDLIGAKLVALVQRKLAERSPF